MPSGAVTVGSLIINMSANTGQLKSDMTDVTASVQSSSQSIVNAWAGVAAASENATSAGSRLVAQLENEIATFGMSSQELLQYKANLNGVGAEVAALQGRLEQMRASQASFSSQSAAADADATARIREMVAASMTELAVTEELAGSMRGLASAEVAATNAGRNFADAQRLQVLNMQGVSASMKAAQDGTAALSVETQKILARYDPLGTKLRSLQGEFATLRKEMGNSVDPAAMKAFQGLEDEISKTQALMAKAGVDGFGKMEEGAKKGAFATAGATRELIVLGHEVLSGNFSRMPGSFMVLAERMSFTSALLNPMTLGFVALGGAAIGIAVAMAQGHEQMVAMNNALLVTSNYAGMSRQSMDQLAVSMTQTHEVTIGTANAIVLALTASGKIGGEAIGTIGHFISDFAKSTGQSVDEIAPKMISLFEDPIKGAQELNSTMHFLTTTQIEHIAALERTGQAQKAQDELAKAASEHMPKQAQNIGIVTQAVLDQRDAWLKLLAAMQKPNDSKLQADGQAQGIRDQISEYLASGLTRKDPAVVRAQAALDALEPAIKKQKELTQAEKDAAAANELQAKSWDAVKTSSTAYHIQELKDRLTLINSHQSEAGPDFAAQEAAKRDAIRKTSDEIEAAERSIGAAGRQLNEQQLAGAEALREVKLKAYADDTTALYKLGIIGKDEFDRRILNTTLEENLSKQTYERSMLRIAGLTAAERQAHEQKLELLKAELDAAESKGVNAQQIDDKKAMDDYITALNKAGTASVKSLDEQIAKERQHGLEIGLTKDQIDQLRSAQAKAATADLQAQSDAITLLLQRTDLNDKARQIYSAMLPDINAQIDAQRTLSQLIGDNATLEANAKAAADAAKAWKRTTDTIQTDLTNAILDGGGRGLTKLVHDIEFAFAKMVLQPILAPISSGLGSLAAPFMGGDGSGAASAAPGSVGSTSSLIGAAQLASSVYKAITGGFTSIGSTISTTVADTVQAGLYQSGLSSNLLTNGAFATSAGSAASGASGALAGHYIGNAIAGEYSVSHGEAVTNIASIIGAVVGGPIGGAIGGAIGGLFNRAFGMGPQQVTGQGISGTLSATNLTGSNYTNWHEDGGWFRSDKNGTNNTPFSAQTSAQFTQGLAAIEQASAGFAKSLGVSADWVTSYSKTFNIALTGDATKDTQAVTDFFNGVGDELANKLVPNLASFSKTGETASATLQRLAGDFQATNQIAQLMGKTGADLFGSLGVSSTAAREQLIMFAGGVSTLGQQVQSYSNNFITDAERLVPVQKALDAAMASLGLSGVQTREQFKAVVDSLDLTTQAGAQEFASLMALSDAFAQVHAVTTAVTRSEADIANERQGLQDQLDTLTMTQVQLLDKQRNALDAANRPLFDMVQAAQKLANTSTDMAKFRDAAQSLHDGLLTGNLSTLTPEQQYAELRNQYEQTKSAALGGDTAAQGNVANALTAFLTASQKINGGDSQYAQDFAMGQQDSAAMAQWAAGQVSSAQAQLNAMNSANAILTTIAQGINNLPTAIANVPINPANYGGADSVNVLAAAVKSLQASNDNLNAQIAALRAEQSQQTGSLMSSNAQTQQATSDAIVSGVSTAVERAITSNYKLVLE